MEEVWKDIPGFEGEYQISNMGKVKSFSRYQEGRILKPWLTKGNGKSGYYYISLGRKHRQLVHRLVALTFLIKNNQTVNHKDGNKLNNRVDNLEWVSYSENNKHAYTNKLKKAPNLLGGEICNHKLTEKQVILIRELRKQEVPVKELTKLFSVHYSTIYNIIRKSTWKNI